MAQSFADAELIPALIAGLEAISVASSDNVNVRKVERWDAWDRDTSEPVTILVRTGVESYQSDGGNWLVTRTLEIACIDQQDRSRTKTTDELYGDIAFDVVKKLGSLDQDESSNAYKASMGAPSVSWFQNDNPEIQQTGVSVEVPYSWLQDKGTGAYFGPAN